MRSCVKMNILKRFIWMFFVFVDARTQEAEDLVTTSEVSAVVGKSVALPCDIVPDSHDDRVYMVLWFKHFWTKPFYSFDVRGRSFDKAIHWSDDNVFGKRARFDTNMHPASLVLDDVMMEDYGIYRCRVDFKNSPTRNFRILLNVIVPPHKMMLFRKDKIGDDKAVPGVIGPLRIGESFTLYCEVRGGRPRPNITWVHGHKQITHLSVETSSDETATIVSQLTMTNAQRSWYQTVIRCQASNTNLITPYERMATIEMHLGPTSAKITTRPRTVKEGDEVVLVCVSHGSRPPAEITWYDQNWKPFDEMHSAVVVNETYTNETTTLSRVILTPSADMDGSIVRCRAENTLLSSAIDDAFKLNVIYKPIVTLALGSSLHGKNITEGDDIYFECHIKTNPRELRIRWYHENEPITPSSNVMISQKSLILQKVHHTQRGRYTCKVTNEVGETTSNEVFLRVLYAPVCSHQTNIVVGTRIGEYFRLRCVVYADPADAISFIWYFNNSRETIVVSQARYGEAFLLSNGGMASEIRYLTAGDMDYGSLNCVATNSVGQQVHACTFHVVPASRPAKPQDCVIKKIERHSEPLLAIRCTAGYNGGLWTHYTLETSRTKQVLVNTSFLTVENGDPVPPVPAYDVNNPGAPVYIWMNVSWAFLEDVEPDEHLIIRTSNSKGESEPVVLPAMEFREPVKKLPEKRNVPDIPDDSVPFGISFLILMVLLIITISTSIIICKRRYDAATTTPAESKRPVQAVVQIDSRGHRRLFAYPAATSPKEAKPDILIPKNENGPPRVVLESSGNTYSVRDVRPQVDSDPTPNPAPVTPPR